MNITKENVDSLNALLRVHIEQNDYEQKVEEALRNYKKKATIKGFRPGMVPMGMIKKMVGTQVLVEEVNKLVNESIFDYLKRENIKILGEPLFNEKEQPPINWDVQKEFDFVFDLGLIPEINLELNKKIKVPFYRIEIEEENTQEYIDDYCRRFGRIRNVEVVEPKDMMRGKIRELDTDGKPLEGGIQTENTPLVLSDIMEEETRELFIGRKTGDTVIIDFRKVVSSNTELAALLAVSKEKAATINSLFEFTITEIVRYEKAQVNEDLYKKVFGEDSAIADEKEFRARVNEQIARAFEVESNYRLAMDIKEIILERADLHLPVDFLKRWLQVTNNKITTEQLEKEFPLFEKNLKWQLIKNHLINRNGITITDEELKEYAHKYAVNQFRQYNFRNVTNEHLDYFVQSMLSREDDRKRMIEGKQEEKVIEYIKSNITLEEKPISQKDFKQLFENPNDENRK